METLSFLKWLRIQIYSYELYVKGNLWKYPDNDNWFTDEQLLERFKSAKY